ncbi:hypothetical protein XH98_10825 [Bradyrhizobium sp. CCBAU 51745]|nr:hypothetical protein [Bradyrhizobium sp. CCBAU 51745]
MENGKLFKCGVRSALALHSGIEPTGTNSTTTLSASWPGLTRPSTTCLCRKKNVDARDKPGHDEFVEHDR